jgi:hypothetical protein
MRLPNLNCLVVARAPRRLPVGPADSIQRIPLASKIHIKMCHLSTCFDLQLAAARVCRD